jgi:hypothetical protein
MMTEQPTEPTVFALGDGDGGCLTSERAEARLLRIVTDPEMAHELWDVLGQVDSAADSNLQVLALYVNPSLRERFWPRASDHVKFWSVVYEPDDDMAGLAKQVVAETVAARYHVPGGMT